MENTMDNENPVPESVPQPGVPQARRRKRIVREQGAVLKPHRPGTKRALVVELLTGEGATFEGVQDAIAEAFPGGPWDTRTAYEGITLISSLLGYWVEEDADTGVIRAGFLTEDALKAALEDASEEDAA
mgnify:CR=1 FL=1